MKALIFFLILLGVDLLLLRFSSETDPSENQDDGEDECLFI